MSRLISSKEVIELKKIRNKLVKISEAKQKKDKAINKIKNEKAKLNAEIKKLRLETSKRLDKVIARNLRKAKNDPILKKKLIDLKRRAKQFKGPFLKAIDRFAGVKKKR